MLLHDRMTQLHDDTQVYSNVMNAEALTLGDVASDDAVTTAESFLKALLEIHTSPIIRDAMTGVLTGKLALSYIPPCFCIIALRTQPMRHIHAGQQAREHA